YPYSFLFSLSRHSRLLHSFPTRRSSDLLLAVHQRAGPFDSAQRAVVSVGEINFPIRAGCNTEEIGCGRECGAVRSVASGQPSHRDRKSTRLNSSHVSISYAVFCLKKKTK